MRSLGGILLLVGVFGFVYASDQVALAGGVPEGLSLAQSWGYTAMRWEAARYGAALSGVVGVILFMMPQGR